MRLDLAEHGLDLHPFQPYPELDGFWSFSALLANGWSAASVTFAAVRPMRNTVEFQLVLTIGTHRNIIDGNAWPEPLRPHANTRRTCYVNRDPQEVFLGTLGQFRLDTWTPDMAGQQMIADFSIARRAS